MFFFFFKEYKDRAAALQSPVGAEFIPQRLSQRILCVCKEPAVVQMFTLRLLRIWPPCVFVCGEQGALLVLLQHQHLSLPQEEDKTNLREDTPSEEPEMALFSLVATNPQTGRSVLVTQLTPPNAWRSRWVKERRQARLTFARWHVDEPPLCGLQAVWSWRQPVPRGGAESERRCLCVGARPRGGPSDAEGSRGGGLAAGALGRGGHAGDWTSKRRCVSVLLQRRPDLLLPVETPPLPKHDLFSL